MNKASLLCTTFFFAFFFSAGVFSTVSFSLNIRFHREILKLEVRSASAKGEDSKTGCVFCLSPEVESLQNR